MLVLRKRGARVCVESSKRQHTMRNLSGEKDCHLVLHALAMPDMVIDNCWVLPGLCHPAGAGYRRGR